MMVEQEERRDPRIIVTIWQRIDDRILHRIFILKSGRKDGFAAAAIIQEAGCAESEGGTP